MPRPGRNGRMQLVLPLLSHAEVVERRAYYEAKTGELLGRHRKWRYAQGLIDKPRGKIAAAVAAGEAQARGGQGHGE